MDNLNFNTNDEYPITKRELFLAWENYFTKEQKGLIKYYANYSRTAPILYDFKDSDINGIRNDAKNYYDKYRKNPEEFKIEKVGEEYFEKINGSFDDFFSHYAKYAYKGDLLVNSRIQKAIKKLISTREEWNKIQKKIIEKDPNLEYHFVTEDNIRNMLYDLERAKSEVINLDNKFLLEKIMNVTASIHECAELRLKTLSLLNDHPKQD